MPVWRIEVTFPEKYAPNHKQNDHNRNDLHLRLFEPSCGYELKGEAYDKLFQGVLKDANVYLDLLLVLGLEGIVLRRQEPYVTYVYDDCEEDEYGENVPLERERQAVD